MIPKCEKYWPDKKNLGKVVPGVPKSFKAFVKDVFASDERLMAKHNNKVEKVMLKMSIRRRKRNYTAAQFVIIVAA